LENATIEGAKSVLVNLAGGENLTLQEYQDVVELITENCAEDALIIAGQAYNPELGEKIKVTVVATGFARSTDSINQEITELDFKKRRFEGPMPEKAQENRERRQPVDQENKEDVITVNRWQDLQQQLGSRSQSNDFSFPAVLRYQRGEKDES
jgi:cell division protein FtsZ